MNSVKMDATIALLMQFSGVSRITLLSTAHNNKFIFNID